jgi:hypothetical protein
MTTTETLACRHAAWGGLGRLVLLLAASAPVARGQAPDLGADPAGPTVTLRRGDVKVVFRDNSESPAVLSGADSLFDEAHAPGFDAFDPDSKGASAGLNFEHIISGHRDPSNKFTPRSGPFPLYRLNDGRSVRLVRRAGDDPWGVSSTLTYTPRDPNAIDVDFRCVPHRPERFGRRGYAVFFFANYMNDVADVALHFRGLAAPGGRETWISADAPKGHRDWNGGGTYRHVDAPALAYDDDHNFTLNLWSYDGPRYTKPFYYGRAARGMCLLMMFDRAYTERDEVRFSLFKFKLPKFPRPAWDWQYVIHRVQQDQTYGFRARLVWKPFVSPEDCLAEYERWAAGLARSGGDRP